MALLLSSNDVKHNLSVFQRAAASRGNVPRVQPPALEEIKPALVHASARSSSFDLGVIGNGAEPLDPLPPAASSQELYFTNVENHVDVLSTLVSTAMGYSNYLPNSARNQNGTVVDEAIGFNNFLIAMRDLFPDYVVLVDSAGKQVSNSEHSTSNLLSGIMLFVEAGQKIIGGKLGDAVGDAMTSLIKGVAHDVSSTSESYSSQSQYNLFKLEGPAANPMVSLYYSRVAMSTSSSGKGYAQDENLDCFRVTYRLLSSSVIADAKILAEARVKRAQDTVDLINQFNQK